MPEVKETLVEIYIKKYISIFFPQARTFKLLTPGKKILSSPEKIQS